MYMNENLHEGKMKLDLSNISEYILAVFIKKASYKIPHLFPLLRGTYNTSPRDSTVPQAKTSRSPSNMIEEFYVNKAPNQKSSKPGMLCHKRELVVMDRKPEICATSFRNRITGSGITKSSF